MTPGHLARRGARVVGVGAVIVLALVAILVALRTELPTNPGVMSDALGPESGEPVAEYRERAAATLDGRDDGAARWALLTAERPWSVSEASAVSSGLPRLSTLVVQVPRPGVAMPVVNTTLAEPVSGEIDRGPVIARTLQRLSDTALPPVDRATELRSLTADRLRAGEPGIIGVIVRGPVVDLRAVAATPGVRAVEALPADAVWGRFALRPLLPQQVDSADPLPDDAPIPPG